MVIILDNAVKNIEMSNVPYYIYFLLNALTSNWPSDLVN